MLKDGLLLLPSLPLSLDFALHLVEIRHHAAELTRSKLLLEAHLLKGALSALASYEPTPTEQHRCCCHRDPRPPCCAG